MIITDCHIHIQPMELFKPEALALMKKSRKDFDLVAEYCSSPKAFLKHLELRGARGDRLYPGGQRVHRQLC
jgi:hypothetical protein